MNMLKQATMAMVLATGAVGLAEAHHAVNSQFNANETMPFTGVLEKTFIGNPHSYLYFVRMVNGQQEHWTFETDAVVALKRAGLSVRDSLKIGDPYSITYNPSLDGATSGLMTAIKLHDGRVISMSAKNQQNAANNILNAQKLLNGPQPGQP
ncbi:MAG TPA: DUF6152 family protein [Steroidobacteraceae bacterium]|nr:DUF6152 family protein [Steroidobacteraceae bacterium]